MSITILLKTIIIIIRKIYKIIHIKLILLNVYQIKKYPTNNHPIKIIISHSHIMTHSFNNHYYPNFDSYLSKSNTLIFYI